MNNLALRPGWLFAPDSDGSLHLVSLTGERSGLHVRKRAEIVKMVLALLDGSRSYTEILDAVPEFSRNDAAKVLTELDDKEVISKTSPGFQESALRKRYIRQMEYFEDCVGTQAGALASQEQISTLRVCVVGVGGVGNFVVQNLAMAGIRDFVLVDPDRVELSNLSRQILFRQSDVGKLKVEAAAEWLMTFDSDCTVEPVPVALRDEKDIAELDFVGDVIIRTAGYMPSPMGRALNRFALKRDLYYLSVGGRSWGPLVKASDASRPCLGCVEQMFSSRALFGSLAVERSMARDTHSPVFGPVLSRTASAAIGDLLLDLAGIRPSGARRGICVETRDGQSRIVEVGRRPDCKDCGVDE